MNKPNQDIKQFIEKQLTSNSGKNLLASNEISSLKFIDVNEMLVRSIKEMDAKTEQEMVDFAADEALQEFCRINQYFSFNSQSVEELKSIYRQLNSTIRMLKDDASTAELEFVSQQHYNNLCDWLVKTNAFAGKMYDKNQEFAQPVACSEYPPSLQLNILQLDIKTMLQPVLDIGCGREMNLVNYLRDNGIEAYGIDRFENKSPFYQKTDWLEYQFESNKWGTIISNLGFSNHFTHHNARIDGKYRDYAIKYMEILDSLQLNGSFHYSPDLPFIEVYIDKSKYRCINLSIEGYAYKASQITKIG
ncbi:MAG: hypothetical protein PHS59_07545 [Paludibacter sp.]|nr:hypothetical protein [Paludibacter sp.]